MTSSEERLTIGKVLARLRPEFGDVTASKIRFLEAEGLVAPNRTDSGYRTYTSDDVARLRYVLAAQRDRFWPLKVIRNALDALDRGLTEPADDHSGPRPPAPTTDPQVPDGASLRGRGNISLTGPELREATGIDRDTLQALENFGLVAGRWPGALHRRRTGRRGRRQEPGLARARGAPPAVVSHRGRPRGRTRRAGARHPA